MLNGNTVIDSGTVTGSHSLIYDKNWNRNDKIQSIGWRNELDMGADWKGTADIGYSRSDRDELYTPVGGAGECLRFLDFSSPEHGRPRNLGPPRRT